MTLQAAVRARDSLLQLNVLMPPAAF